MSKRNRDTGRREGPGQEPPAGAPAGALQVTALVGLGVLLVLSFLTWNEAHKLGTGLDTRLGQLQGTLSQLSAKIDQAALRTQQAQQPQGPDPRKIYAIKTGGAPVEGPDSAAVTIAEFSDFQ